MMTLDQINALSPEEFATAFCDVAEHSPWVAERAAEMRPFTTRDELVGGFVRAMLSADSIAQLALLREHPDLAGKAKLTDDSKHEQAGAGLDRLTPEEFARFTVLNTRYKNHFGFPFIFAVRGATKQQVIASFESRVDNSSAQEFATALQHVAQILRFRLEDRVSP